MTNVLAIDCSADEAVVCAVKDGVFAERRSGKDKRHNGVLLGLADEVLTQLGARPSDFDAFGAVVGPGSFTGIRIGVASVKALCLATDKPAVAIDSLELLAMGEGDCYAAIDARNGNYYAARFAGGEMTDEKLTSGEELFAHGAKVVTERPEDIGRRLVRLTAERAEKGEFDNALEPRYLRKSQAERMKDGD